MTCAIVQNAPTTRLTVTADPISGSPAAAEGAPDEDALLILRVQQRDEAAFSELVERYSSRVWALVSGMLRNKADVEEAVQEIFFKVYRKLPSFEGKSTFYTWLYRVAINTATDHLKRRRWQRIRGFEDMPGYEPVAEDPVPDSTTDRNELRRHLAEAMAALPEKYRNILVLREYEGQSYERIAEILGVALGTVESRLFRARARLKEKLKKYVNT
jgi:RNA polymerase sigma-70 factor, ECF subfamily